MPSDLRRSGHAASVAYGRYGLFLGAIESVKSPDPLRRRGVRVLHTAQLTIKEPDAKSSHLDAGQVFQRVGLRQTCAKLTSENGKVCCVESITALRMAWIQERLGCVVGSDALIELAVEALLEGVDDSPALVELAGFGRSDESEAHDLFAQVVRELKLGVDLPDHPQEMRWELVHWWCRLIVDGQLQAEVAGRLIWIEGWDELGYPSSLQPLVGWVSEWEDWTPAFGESRESYRLRIVEAARDLLALSWPPVDQSPPAC